MTLPLPPRPLGSYVTSVRHGDLLFLSGMLPLQEGHLLYTGKLGRQLTLKQGQEAARLAAMNGLAVAAEALGDLERVRRIIRAAVHVACDPEFTELVQVAEGCSAALLEALGHRGEHTRLVFGAVSLPKGAPIELELLLALG